MRFTFWFFGQEILDFHIQARQPKPAPVEKDKIGGSPFGNFEFGFGENSVQAKNRHNIPKKNSF